MLGAGKENQAMFEVENGARIFIPEPLFDAVGSDRDMLPIECAVVDQVTLARRIERRAVRESQSRR